MPWHATPWHLHGIPWNATKRMSYPSLADHSKSLLWHCHPFNGIVAWYGMVRQGCSGMASNGTARHGMTWYAMARYVMAFPAEACHGMPWRLTWRSMPCHVMLRGGIQWHGHGMTWHSMALHAMACHSVAFARHSMECHETHVISIPCRS